MDVSTRPWTPKAPVDPRATAQIASSAQCFPFVCVRVCPAHGGQEASPQPRPSCSPHARPPKGRAPAVFLPPTHTSMQPLPRAYLDQHVCTCYRGTDGPPRGHHLKQGVRCWCLVARLCVASQASWQRNQKEKETVLKARAAAAAAKPPAPHRTGQQLWDWHGGSWLS